MEYTRSPQGGRVSQTVTCSRGMLSITHAVDDGFPFTASLPIPDCDHDDGNNKDEHHKYATHGLPLIMNIFATG